MKFWICTVTIVFLCVLLNDASSVRNNTSSNTNRSQHSRSFSSVLNPLGIVKATRRLVANGAQILRENLRAHPKLGALGHQSKNAEEMDFSDTIEDPPQKTSRDFQIGRNSVLGGIFRFMGVDSSNVGAIVLNILIFIAEMITNSLVGKDNKNATDARMLKDSFLEWIIYGRNPRVEEILENARNQSLPDRIITTLQEKTGNDTSCVQLLICKISPYIWTVQNTVNDQIIQQNHSTIDQFDFRSLISSNILDKLFDVFPSRSNFIEFGNDCEKHFPNCKLLKFSKAKN